MGRSSFMVPHDATSVCSCPAEKLVVWSLYEYAHLRRWRPFVMKTDDFAMLGDPRHPLRKEAALRLLKALEADGLIRRVRPKDRSAAGTIEVLDPQKVSRVDHENDPSADHETDHDGDGDTPDNDSDRTTKRTADPTPPRTTPVDTPARGDHDPDPNDKGLERETRARDPEAPSMAEVEVVQAPPRPPGARPSTGSIDETLALAICEEWQTTHSQGKLRFVDEDRRPVRRALAQGRTAEDLERLGRYFATSDEFQPRKARENGLMRWSMLLNDKREQRFDLCNAWHERGCIDLEATTGPPRSRGQPKSLAAMLKEDAAKDAAKDPKEATYVRLF
jgi:hypothetical protein